MKYIILMLLFITFSQQATASALRVSLLSSFSSKKLNGEDPDSGASGKLVSNANLHYGLGISYGLSKNWRVLFSYLAQSYEFDNDKELISGDTAISTSQVDLGLKWILFSKTALRFTVTSGGDIAFDVSSDGKAKLFVENRTASSIFLDQILYLGATAYAGVNLGYNFTLNSSEITNHSASQYGAFFVYNTGLGSFKASYDLRDGTKSTSDLDFTDKDANLGLTYTLRF